jgi:multiple sugar transport system permease protein
VLNTSYSPAQPLDRHTQRRSRSLGVIAGRALRSTLLHLVAFGLAVLLVFPFLWMVGSSLKPQDELFVFPPRLIPSVWKVENYTEAWRAARFSSYLVNTILVSVLGTLLTLVVCSMAAYAFAKMRFRFRNAIFWVVLGSQMIPGIITLIPSFIVVKNFPLAGGNNLLGQGGYGLLNSYLGLVLPGASSAFGVFLLRQFFLSLPEELSDAARIDGCGEFSIFWRIVLPLSTAALASLSIFTFQAYWNDFIWPLVTISDDRYRTIQLGLIVFRQRFATEWGPMMAGVTIATLPMLLFFLSAQRYFVRGIALTGLKG